MTDKRTYNRRSDDERIADLQARISELQEKLETKQRPDLVVVREVPKLQKRLREFAQLANQNGRPDIANSTIAFLAGLERMASAPAETPRRARRAGDEGESSDASS
jgi:hypothetical protein